ncbi:MAG: translation initiation factor 2 [Oscillospiraceae bacterium]|jgi:hypothetical protein|nr:translation initiation factor 2 [Oscillospiraceae bacterium]
MLKGITRRVIVVKPDNKLFDEAIFIVRDDPRDRLGISADDVLRQAQTAAREITRTRFAASYLRSTRVAYAVWALLGATAASLVWGLVMMFS